MSYRSSAEGPRSPKTANMPRMPPKLTNLSGATKKLNQPGGGFEHPAIDSKDANAAGCPIFTHTTSPSENNNTSLVSPTDSNMRKHSATNHSGKHANYSVFDKLRNDCNLIENNLDLADKDVLKRDEMAFIIRENDLEMSALLTAQQVEYDFRKNLLEKRLNARQDRKKAKQQQRGTVRGTKRRDLVLEIQEVNASSLEKLKIALFQKRKAFERATSHMNYMHDKQRQNLINAQDRQIVYEKKLSDLETQAMNVEVRSTMQKKFQSRLNHKIALNKRINDQLREFQQVELRHAKEKFEAELSGFEELENLKIKHNDQVNEAKARHITQLHEEKESTLSKHESEKYQKMKKQHTNELKKMQRERKLAVRQLKIQHEQQVNALNLGKVSRAGSNIGSNMGSTKGSLMGSKRQSASTSRDSLTSDTPSALVSAIAEEVSSASPSGFSPTQLKSELMAGDYNDRDDIEEGEDDLMESQHVGIQNLLNRQREELNNLTTVHKAEVNNLTLAQNAKMAEMEERHANELNMLQETQTQDLTALKAFQEKEIAMEESLHDSEMKMLVERRVLNSVLGTVVDGIINIDPIGTILRFNSAGERMFGYKSHEIIGKNIKMLMPVRFSSNHDQYLKNYLTTGIKKVIGSGRRVFGLKKDGSEFPLQLSISEVKEDGEHIFTGIARDLTEEVRLEEEIKRRDQEKHVQLQTMLVELDDAKTKSAGLLRQMLPESVSSALMEGKVVASQSFASATIFFLDIVKFTTLCTKIQPFDTIDLLNDLYNLFDDVISQYDAYKVETIGDSYMVVSGVPKENGTKHAMEIADMALHILHKVYTYVPTIDLGDTKIQVRIGINTGPVVAGVVGSKMPRYCLFGDTVNTASRMESSGHAMKIQLSPSTYNCLKDVGGYKICDRGEIEVKGKGKMTTYWLTGKTDYPYELPPQ